MNMGVVLSLPTRTQPRGLIGLHDKLCVMLWGPTCVLPQSCSAWQVHVKQLVLFFTDGEASRPGSPAMAFRR